MADASGITNVKEALDNLFARMRAQEEATGTTSEEQGLPLRWIREA